MLLSKLAHKDSNLEMTESESVALPFGDGPLFLFYRASLFAPDIMYYITLLKKMQVLFLNSLNFFLNGYICKIDIALYFLAYRKIMVNQGDAAIWTTLRA